MICTIQNWVAAHRGLVGGLLWVGVVVALLCACTPVLVYWLRRRRAWLTEPQRLLEPMPRPAAAFVAGLVAACATGVVALVAAAPIPAWGAAIAGLTVAHLTRWPAAAMLGLMLLAGGFVAAGHLLFPIPLGRGLLLGCALAGLFMLWLERFWKQQLHNGRPWTTAGWLIRYCGMMTVILAVAIVALTLGEMWLGD